MSFKKPENMSDTRDERKSIFDIYCQRVTGERLIVEMQKVKMQSHKIYTRYGFDYGASHVLLC